MSLYVYKPLAYDSENLFSSYLSFTSFQVTDFK